jgi:hypothetical protein
MKKSLFSALIACVALVFASCEPKVQPVDYTVKVSATELTLENGASQKLTAVITPTPATTYPLVWTSSNPEVVTVNASGIVQAVGLGTATITVTVNVPEGDETVGQVTPATCVVNVTNDAVLNTFELGGYGLFDLGSPIAGTDTVLKISVGEVTCQLAPALYYVWDKGIVLSGNSLTGAGFLLPVETYTYVITDSPNGAYNGYYISGFDVVVDTLASAEEALAYSSKNGVYAAPYGQLLDETMYGDAWDAILNFSEEPTEEEINAAYDLYYGSQTGTPFFHLDLNTGSQSYYYGNVSYLYLTEDRETGELYYALKLEWYDHVNIGRWFGLLAEYELDEEGNEVPTAIVKPYDMRKINKEYLVLPPAEEEEPTEVKAIQPMKPIRLNAKQADLLKSTTRSMYKK